MASIAGLGVTLVATQALVSNVGLIAIPIGFVLGSLTKLILLSAIVPLRVRRFPVLAAEELSRAD
jgi:hypothetical protein